MSDIIKYDFAGLATLSGDLNRHFQALESLSHQLKSEVTRLGDNWTSQHGAQAYQAAQAHWDRLFGEARTHLHGLGRGVEQASDTMARTDRAVGATFGA
ncbi:WXG100 family type VII secretion target [Gordonia sp. CPCC 206044]|uniref:WXG100 family type VII secretion target n=1 Tax=Gordonia sp. CPCC 206044 TaxID=3140793 RepID=UPI003AF3B6F7